MGTQARQEWRTVVILNGFELIAERGIAGKEKKQRIAILGRYPRSTFSQQLFAQLGLMHLVAPFFPRSIVVNFGIAQPIRELIGAMYASENHDAPIINAPTFIPAPLPLSWRPQPNRVAIAYSAGKDSLWNLSRAQERYGTGNVLAVHIRGLNRNNSVREWRFARRQSRTIGFPLRAVHLLNGSRNDGYLTMRSRDMFLAALASPLALEFGASRIITEGFEEAKRDEPFTGQEESMRHFNRILKALGVPIRVTWKNRREMLVIKDLYRYHPEWMPLVCNCFTIPPYQGSHRQTFRRSRPHFPLYASQCGVCVKCKITNLARIFYDPAMRDVPTEEIRSFLINVVRWVRTSGTVHSDMILGSFTDHLARACARYGINAKPTV